MLKEINLLSKGRFLIRALCLMGVIFLFGLMGFVGSPQAVAFHAGYKPPIFFSSGIATSFTDSTQNSLNVSVSGRSGIFEAHCGSSDNAALTITGPYFMSYGSMSVSSVTEQVTSGEIQQTAAGSAGSGCSDTGQAGSFQVGQTLNVAGLSNGTYTLSVNLCATSSGPCSTSTKLITINRVTPTDPPLSGSCAGIPNPVARNTNVTWTAYPSGGTGSYTYSWSGAVSGATRSVSASYSQLGEKAANVTISSGGQNVTKSCMVSVEEDNPATCTIEVNSNVGTQWIIGGDGFTSWLANGQNPDTYEIYSPNPDSHPMRVGDGFGITASELAGYTKTVNPSANQTCTTAGQKVTFNIQYTAVPPSEEDPVCSGPTSGAPGQNLTFGASKGSGLGYTWSGGQNPSATGNGTSFTTSFSSTGSKTITLRDSAGKTGTCPVTISSGLSCSASPSGVSPGGSTTLTAGGGTGTGYTWTTGGSPASPSGNPVSVTYNTAGSKTVTVRDSSGATAQCYVSVFNTTQPVCYPATQTVNVGQAANFGTSPWGWTGLWYSPEGTPERHSHSYISQYSTTYSTPGTKTVWYSRNSNSSTCTVNVVAPQVNNASCVAMSYPTQVVTGSTFPATVTMKNTGSIDWKVPLHRLGSKNPNGNNVWGLTRVNLPFSPVNVGQQVTFNFTATAPSTAGTRSFDWGMLEETIEWFGQTCVASPQINVICGGGVNVSSNIATTWRLSGPDGVVNQTAPAINQSYTNKPSGSYTLSNIPTLSGYKTPTVAPAASQALSCNSAITFTINYQCTDQDGDKKCDSVSGCVGGNCGGGPGGPGPDNCPADYNPDQTDTDGDGAGDVCDDGEPPVDPEGGADFALSSTNNIRVDKSAGDTESNTTTIKVTPYNGYDDAVALSVLSGPAVEYVFDDGSLSNGEYATGSDLHVVIPSDFQRGNYPIQVRGLSGGIVRTTTVILSVDEAGPKFEEF